MAREVLIRFRTQALDKAKAASEAIVARLREAVKTVKDNPALKRALRQNIREEQKLEKDRLAEQSVRLSQFRRTGAALSVDEDTPSLLAARRAQQLAARVQGGLAGGAGQLAALAASVPQVALAIALTAKIKELVEAEVGLRLKDRLAGLSAEIEERAFEANFARRVQEDPAFAAQMTVIAGEQILDERRRGLRPWVSDDGELGD